MCQFAPLTTEYKGRGISGNVEIDQPGTNLH
jgi:hypothetical protein